MPEDPGSPIEEGKKGYHPIPRGKIWHKGLTVGTGQTPVKKFALMLREDIIAGKAKPSFIVSHRISLDEAPDAYMQFDQRADGYTKVIIKPGK